MKLQLHSPKFLSIVSCLNKTWFSLLKEVQSMLQRKGVKPLILHTETWLNCNTNWTITETLFLSLSLSLSLILYSWLYFSEFKRGRNQLLLVAYHFQIDWTQFKRGKEKTYIKSCELTFIRRCDLYRLCSNKRWM